MHTVKVESWPKSNLNALLWKIAQYAGFELRQGYFPLPVLFRNWGGNGVSLLKWWDRWCIRCKVKFSLFIYMNAYPYFIEFNFEYVHQIASLCGNLSYNIFISCQFKVQLIFKAAKFHKWKQYLQSRVCLP